MTPRREGKNDDDHTRGDSFPGVGHGDLPRSSTGVISDNASAHDAECEAELTSHGYPPPLKTVQIVPQLLWDELGVARFRPANGRHGGPSIAIVHWPRA